MGIVRLNESLLISFSINSCSCLSLVIVLHLDVFSKVFVQNIGQFRALADQLFRNPDYHKHVRKQVIKQV
jgi:hypothetical protein